MTGNLMFRWSRYILVSLSFLFAMSALLGGCRSSKQAAKSDDAFFEPSGSVNSAPVQKAPAAAPPASPSAWDNSADTLVKRQKEQDRRIGALTEQLQRLEASRKGDQRDSPQETVTSTAKPSAPEPKPAVQADEKAVRLYEGGHHKEAVEVLRGLLQPGITKDLEEKYHFMLGVSYFNLKQFDLAAASLKTITDRKGSRMRPDAFFVLGQTYKQLGARRQAIAMFEVVLRESPKAALAASAREELKGLASKE